MDFQVDNRFLKYDESLGLVFGWGIVCKEKGEDYFDLQGDHIPEEAMLKASSEFMQNSRRVKEMHAGEDVGEMVFAWPMTAEVAKAFGYPEPERTGLMIAMKPSEATVAKIKSNEFTGFSIGGKRIRDEDVSKYNHNHDSGSGRFTNSGSGGGGGGALSGEDRDKAKALLNERDAIADKIYAMDKELKSTFGQFYADKKGLPPGDRKYINSKREEMKALGEQAAKLEQQSRDIVNSLGKGIERQPKGSPNGGQFAPSHGAAAATEPSTSLSHLNDEQWKAVTAPKESDADARARLEKINAVKRDTMTKQLQARLSGLEAKATKSAGERTQATANLLSEIASLKRDIKLIGELSGKTKKYNHSHDAGSGRFTTSGGSGGGGGSSEDDTGHTMSPKEKRMYDTLQARRDKLVERLGAKMNAGQDGTKIHTEIRTVDRRMDLLARGPYARGNSLIGGTLSGTSPSQVRENIRAYRANAGVKPIKLPPPRRGTTTPGGTVIKVTLP